MANFDAINWLVVAAIGLLIWVVDDIYTDVSSRREPSEVVEPAQPYASTSAHSVE